MSQIITTEALVLRGIRWSESSKIVHLFTAEAGMVRAIAKGALRPKSPFRGVLEALNHVEVVLSVKESRSLQIVTSASLLDGFLEIKEELNKTAIAFAILELINKLIHTSEAIPSFFRYTISTLRKIASADDFMLDLYFIHFLLQLSKELGFGWALEECLVCEKPPEDFPVYLNSENGGILCSSCFRKMGIKGMGLNRTEWEQLLTLLKSDLSKIEQMGNITRNVRLREISQILIHHLAIHTEGEIELKSLNWYQ